MSDSNGNRSPGTREQGPVDWREAFAYTAGVQAFVYGFPYIYYAQLRHAWVTHKRDTEVVPYAAVNHFWHAGRLLDATYRDGGSPSTDSLYSFAWVDLRAEPVILSHPDMGERYFAFQLAGFTSDNFDYVGQRTTGATGGTSPSSGRGGTATCRLEYDERNRRRRRGCWSWAGPRSPAPPTSRPRRCCSTGTGSPRSACGGSWTGLSRTVGTSTPLRPRGTRWRPGSHSTQCWPRTRRRSITTWC